MKIRHFKMITTPEKMSGFVNKNTFDREEIEIYVEMWITLRNKNQDM